MVFLRHKHTSCRWWIVGCMISCSIIFINQVECRQFVGQEYSYYNNNNKEENGDGGMEYGRGGGRDRGGMECGRSQIFCLEKMECVDRDETEIGGGRGTGTDCRMECGKGQIFCLERMECVDRAETDIGGGRGTGTDYRMECGKDQIFCLERMECVDREDEEVNGGGRRGDCGGADNDEDEWMGTIGITTSIRQCPNGQILCLDSLQCVSSLLGRDTDAEDCEDGSINDGPYPPSDGHHNNNKVYPFVPTNRKSKEGSPEESVGKRPFEAGEEKEEEVNKHRKNQQATETSNPQKSHEKDDNNNEDNETSKGSAGKPSSHSTENSFEKEKSEKSKSESKPKSTQSESDDDNKVDEPIEKSAESNAQGGDEGKDESDVSTPLPSRKKEGKLRPVSNVNEEESVEKQVEELVVFIDEKEPVELVPQTNQPAPPLNPSSPTKINEQVADRSTPINPEEPAPTDSTNTQQNNRQTEETKEESKKNNNPSPNVSNEPAIQQTTNTNADANANSQSQSNASDPLKEQRPSPPPLSPHFKPPATMGESVAECMGRISTMGGEGFKRAFSL